MTLIIALIFGMLLASAAIFLGFDLSSNGPSSILYKKIKLVSTMVDTYKAYKTKKSSKFFDDFLGNAISEEGRKDCPVTKAEYLVLTRDFRQSLHSYLNAIKSTQDIELIDAQPLTLEELKTATLCIVRDLEKIREHIRDLHMEGVKATALSYRSRDGLRRINEEESNAFRALDSLMPKAEEEDSRNERDPRGNQRPRRG